MQRFGEKLRTLRKRHRMTLQQLAEALGYTSASYMQEIESGKKAPMVDLVIRTARLFQISADDLLFDERELPDPDETPPG